jgi:hypothetical protein
MTVAEVLKSAGIADDVAAGLAPDVVKALTGFVTDADAKLSTAAQEAEKATELRRQAELDKNEVRDYVEKYGTSLTEMASVEAKNKALVTYLESLKEQGFDIKLPEVVAAKPVVPGSPANGGNALDEGKILGRVGDVMGQYLDANNEHIRLFGVPLPDSSLLLGEEAARARKPIGQYIAEKYKFKDRQTAREQESFDKRVADAVKQQVEAERQKDAEARGSNPALRAGETSRNSFVPKIKSDEFHKSDGNMPVRERHRRMLDRIHQDRQAAQGA